MFSPGTGTLATPLLIISHCSDIFEPPSQSEILSLHASLYVVPRAHDTCTLYPRGNQAGIEIARNIDRANKAFST